MFYECVKLRWINGACYEMVLPDGTVIVLDPYVTPEKLEGFSVNDFTGADYILCSHTHYDHTADIGALAERYNSKLIAGEMSIMSLADYFDLNYSHCYPISSGECYHMPEFTVQAIRSKHIGAPDNNHGTPSATLESSVKKNNAKQGPADQFGWVELYDYAITLPGNYRILIVAGINAYSKRMQLVVKGKNRGTICGMIWFGKGKRLLPYRAYVPTSYREGHPMPLVILTHGGSSPQSVEFARAGHKFENIAEKRGYMLFGIDGYIESSFYGSIYPTSSTIGEIDKSKVNMKNPKGLSEAVLALRKEGEEACEEQILYAFKLLEVDKKRVYMMGNSMGGAGTYYLASINPGMFRAIAPCGGSVNPDFFPLDTLKGMPICLFAGSEDENGLEPLEEATRLMKERGLDHSFYVIGGAKHPDGYVEALDEIFDFFDSNA